MQIRLTGPYPRVEIVSNENELNATTEAVAMDPNVMLWAIAERLEAIAEELAHLNERGVKLDGPISAYTVHP